MAETTADAGAVTNAGLHQAITERLDAVHVEITDMSGGCGQAFSAIVVSPQFKGLNHLSRHRRVNAALKAEIAAIHAWTAKCRTPEEWERDCEAAAAATTATTDTTTTTETSA